MTETIHIGEYKAIENAQASTLLQGKLKLRDEQEEAIKDAFDRFKTGNKFLWNAKMRFGKTLCALELAHRMGEQRTLKRVRRTIIVTHRPVLGESWREDFVKIFGEENPDYHFATKFDDSSDEGSFTDLNQWVERNPDTAHLIFFVSMQYLRGSKTVGGSNRTENELKEQILNAAWDLIVVDEAHEGTQTDLGQSVINKLTQEGKRRMLQLSGTPFNLVEGFNDHEIFTWDYVQEQQAKAEWSLNHPDLPEEDNPYHMLPRMEIRTWTLDDLEVGEGKHFDIHEFLRIAEGAAAKRMGRLGCFVHEEDVKKFLDKLSEKSDKSLYPFSTDEFRQELRHTLWVVPGVKAAAALEKLLKEHKVFRRFTIINVAGKTDDEEVSQSAIKVVEAKIKGEEGINSGQGDDTRTITIACSRLTTGVTIPQWTGVLYLKGSINTKAATYMQTIFRVQSPWEYKDRSTGEHRMKTKCYVFDFAPDRTLKVIAETAKFRTLTQDQKRYASAKTLSEKDRENITEFINYCPVIAMGGGMREQQISQIVNRLYAHLNSAYVERAVHSGFDDSSVYNIEELLRMDADFLNGLAETIGKTEGGKRLKVKDKDKAKPIVISGGDFTPLPKKKKDPKEETPEERQQREEAQRRKEELRKEQDNRIQIIRSIAIRIPLMMFGASGTVSRAITIDNITDPQVVDDRSWAEFMPKGATREVFLQVKRAFSRTVFNESGERYRELAREADAMHVEDRIRRITEIHSWFRNPKSETVLTPWPVVNRHMSDTLGGWCFFDETFKRPNQRPVSSEEAQRRGLLFDYEDDPMPRHVDRGEVTRQVFRTNAQESPELNAHILEINSKSGLYPLYLAYSLYRERLKDYLEANLLEEGQQSVEEEQVIWDDVLERNIYIICNTPMAEYITRRTLVGFRGDDDNDAHSRGLKEFAPERMNIRYENLIERAKSDREALVRDLRSPRFWHKTATDNNMIKFDAVVSNPPYQEMNEKNTRNPPVYHHFFDLAFMLSDRVTLITPGRFLFRAGQTPKEWMDRILSDSHFRVIKYFPKSSVLFPEVEIKGGVVISYRDTNLEGEAIETFFTHEELQTIVEKVSIDDNNLSSIMSGGRSDLKFNDHFLQQYPNSIKDRIRYIQEKHPTTTSLGHDEEYELRSSTFESLPYVFKQSIEEDSADSYYHLLGLYESKRVWRYIERTYMTPRYSENNIDSYKVFVPGAMGNGIFGEALTKTEIGEPGDSSTQTFISMGNFATREEAANCATYIKTKFLRCMLGILKKTQANPPKVWANVPLQDFTAKSDIDWSVSVAEIDRQLYTKYGLTDEEVAFIERMIKPME